MNNEVMTNNLNTAEMEVVKNKGYLLGFYQTRYNLDKELEKKIAIQQGKLTNRPYDINKPLLERLKEHKEQNYKALKQLENILDLWLSTPDSTD